MGSTLVDHLQLCCTDRCFRRRKRSCAHPGTPLRPAVPYNDTIASEINHLHNGPQPPPPLRARAHSHSAVDAKGGVPDNRVQAPRVWGSHRPGQLGMNRSFERYVWECAKRVPYCLSAVLTPCTPSTIVVMVEGNQSSQSQSSIKTVQLRLCIQKQVKQP